MEVDGVLAPLTLGRALVNASLELERVVATVPFARLSVAAFIDVATISPADESKGARGFLDGGVGLRFGTASGAVRVDVARSTDGSRAFSLGWQPRLDGSGL
jgi:hypothetical protein